MTTRAATSRLSMSFTHSTAWTKSANPTTPTTTTTPILLQTSRSTLITALICFAKLSCATEIYLCIHTGGRMTIGGHGLACRRSISVEIGISWWLGRRSITFQVWRARYYHIQVWVSRSIGSIFYNMTGQILIRWQVHPFGEMNLIVNTSTTVVTARLVHTLKVVLIVNPNVNLLHTAV